MQISRKYGVQDRNGYLPRVTFVIGPDGKIAHVFPRVNPNDHANQVLDVIRGLKPS